MAEAWETGGEEKPLWEVGGTLATPPEKPRSFGQTVGDAVGSGVRGVNHALSEAIALPYRALRSVASEGVSIPVPGTDIRGEIAPLRNLLPQKQSEVVHDFFKPAEEVWPLSMYPAPKPETNAGRYAAAAGEFVGNAVPFMFGAGLQGARMAPAALETAAPARPLTKAFVEPYATNPVNAAKTELAANIGAGLGQEAAKDVFGDNHLAGTAGALAGSMVPGGVGAVASWVRNLAQGSRHQGTPYQRIIHNLGDMTPDELADAMAVGATKMDLAKNRAVLDILGEEMAATDINAPPAARAQQAQMKALPRIADALMPEVAGRIQGAALRDLKAGKDPFPGVPQNEVDNFLVSGEIARGQQELTQIKAQQQDLLEKIASEKRAPTTGEQNALNAYETSIQQSQDRLNTFLAELQAANNGTLTPETLYPTIARAIEQRARERAPETAREQLRRLTNLHRDDFLMFGEYPATVESNQTIRKGSPGSIRDDDAAHINEVGTQQLLDYIANSGSLASSQNVRNAIGRRAPDLKETTENIIRGLGPEEKSAPRSIQDVEAMVEAAKAKESAEYRRVHGDPNLTDNALLASGLQDAIATHSERAAGRSGEQAEAIRRGLKEFFIKLPDGREIIMPTLQMAQDMRGALRNMITKAEKDADNNTLAALRPIYQDVTDVMRRASPEWWEVNKRWADMELDKKAAKLGEALTEKAGSKFREQMKEFQALDPDAQDIVRVYFAQKLIDKIDDAWKLGGGRNLAEVFTKQHIRNMVREVLGDKEALELARMIRDLNVAQRSKNGLKGSQTHLRGQVQKQEDDPHNLAAAIEYADWKKALALWFDKAAAHWREKKNHKMGEVLTTPMSDVPKVAEHLQRLRQSQDLAARYSKRPTLPAFPHTPVPAGLLSEYEGKP